MLFNLLGGFSSKTDFIVSLITLLLRIPAVLLADISQTKWGIPQRKIWDASPSTPPNI